MSSLDISDREGAGEKVDNLPLLSRVLLIQNVRFSSSFSSVECNRERICGEYLLLFYR